jgi:CDP-diacylglycerol--serine O-phosphatidyltransferase
LYLTVSTSSVDFFRFVAFARCFRAVTLARIRWRFFPTSCPSFFFRSLDMMAPTPHRRRRLVARLAELGEEATDVSSRPPKHFSMVREFHLADFFTLANAACGVGAIFAAMSYVAEERVTWFLVGVALTPLALVFDALDGRIARWRHEHSVLGRELDSLADVISFGVAPAALAWAAGMRSIPDAAVLIYFVACGVGRLARYNVTAESLSAGGDKVKFFEGTPIPTSVVLTLVLGWAAWQERLGSALYGGVVTLGPAALHPLVLLFALSGTLMISKTIRIPKP